MHEDGGSLGLDVTSACGAERAGDTLAKAREVCQLAKTEGR